MTRIAYIAPTGVFGGVRIVAEHLNRLSDRGHDCTLLATEQQPLTWLPTRFNQRHVSDPGTGYDVIVGTAITTWGLTRRLADSMGARAIGLMQMADWMFSVKGSPEYDAIRAEFATPLDGVMAISEWLARLNEAVPERKTHRIRNGIDTQLFYPDPFTDAPPFDGVTVVIEGYNHNPAKDIDSMAFSAIRRARFDYGLKLRVLGFSQYPQQFEFDHFWQSPQQHVIRKIYSTADIFLKASRYEGRPGPDMEAMACGAVVCRAITPGMGDDDLLHGYTCFVTEYGNNEQFLKNMIVLAHDHDLRNSRRENGLWYAKEKYDWPAAIDTIEETLTGSVNKPVEDKAIYQYDLASYNQLQDEIVAWEGGQARWLGETLADLLRPTSVIDIGCGPGIYLVPFKPEALVMGVDGAPAAGKALDPIEFVHADLRTDWRFERHVEWVKEDGATDDEFAATQPMRFDLSLCIETGEHLPPDRADYLVDLLTESSDVAFFSAAQPGQGGTMHLNEQPRQWWIDKFRARGWELHPLNDHLCNLIAANDECRKVQWLVGNAFLAWRPQ